MTAQPRPTWVNKALLSARCISVSASDEAQSPWLRRGVQLRVLPSAGVGYPICPFTVWNAGLAVRSGALLNGPGAYPTTSSDDLLVGAWSDGGAIVVLDQAGRVVERSTASMTGFLPDVSLRCTGARLDGAQYRDGLTVDDQTGSPNLPKWLSTGPVDAIGAPLPSGAWWSGCDPAYKSADVNWRMSGVPNTQLPYDDAPGALARVSALAGHLQPSVDELWNGPAMGPPPSLAPITQPLPGNAGAQAQTDAALAIWGASADAAGARYWGFGTTLPLDATINAEIATCFAVAALFVFDDTAPSEALTKLARTAQADPMAQGFTQQLYAAHPGLKQLVDDLAAAGHEVGCLWTVAMATTPPDLPDAPALDATDTKTQWNPDGSWTATLALSGTTTGPIAATRDPNVVLNAVLDEGQPWRRPILAPRAGPNSTAVTVTDRSVPSGNASWTIACADLWGQWSPDGAAAMGPPDLPPMPAPAVVLEFQPGPVPGNNDPASPGTVTITATLAPPAAAAPAITGVQAVLAGATSPTVLDQDPADGTRWTGQAAVDATTPGTVIDVQCTATATDGAGRTKAGDATVTVHDGRPFVSPRTSGILLFAGDRGPDGHAELDLRTPLPASAPADLGWHVYVTDEQLLDPPAGVDEPRWSRANRLRATVNAATTRGQMARLDAQVSDATGELRIRCRLAGRLESVQALQLVPVTKAGLEAPAAGAGCVAFAVPLTDAPPAPSLTYEVSADATGTTVALSVEVAYPGKRAAGGGPPGPVARRSGTSTTPIVGRIRRSASGGDPRTWPVVATIDVNPDDPADPEAGWRWQATYADVLAVTAPVGARLQYVCEAAWPAEPAWDPDPATVVVAGDVTMTWLAAQAHPSTWSEASLPVNAVIPVPPLVLRPTWVDNGDGTATISLTVPVAHPSARPWSMTASALAQSRTVTGVGPELRLDGLDGSISAHTWLLAVTAPDGVTLPLIRADRTPA